MISSISSTANVAVSQQLAANRSEPQADASRAGTQGTANTNASAETDSSVSELAASDRKVRAHEAAHLAAAGALAQGGANFTLVRGPDGQMYAVGGEVSIDVSPGRTPEETLAKAEQIQRAALAPADPSAQDYRVAAQAAQLLQQAQRELAAQNNTSAGADGASGQLTLALTAAYANTVESTPQVNLFA